jgi:hypothetical protein
MARRLAEFGNRFAKSEFGLYLMRCLATKEGFTISHRPCAAPGRRVYL